ncbi:Ig-like domain-containing protein [Candidatus Dojkabacteria bacterium]|jgi:hypothetical protein|nr:Ig-like domain-containing protein [Candidatus Dojkabacteria bacterium]
MSRGKTKSKTPMTKKLEVKSSKEEGMFSMVMGTVIVALGILLFVSGVVMLVLYNLPPREDAALVTPIVTQLPKESNLKEIVVKGTSEYSKVMIWVNDSVVNKNVEVKDGSFEYAIPQTAEGGYKVEVAAINGFPLRHRSLKSSTQVITLDWTAPKSDILFSYTKNTDLKKISVSGVAEPDVTVVLQKNGKEYFAQSDSNGKFKVKNVPLVEGKNNFTVVLRDAAGNTTRADQKVSVIYASGNIDGDGVSTLPNSAGSLEDAAVFLMQNKLMSIFGLMALAGLVGSSAFVIRKVRHEEF